MRIAIFLLLVGFLQTKATDSYSQSTKLSISVSNTELVKVLDKIENQSEFYFLYNEKLIDASRKVSIEAKEERIEDVLKNLFSGTDVEYSIIDRKIILAPAYLSESQQPNKKISGKVTDHTGASLPGASIVVKGTTIGVITDNSGNYSLSNLPENATLQFSFVGMKTQEIAVEGKIIINVKLEEETIGIEEVVAVGYAVQKKSDLTGAVGLVSEKTMKSNAVNTVGAALQGKVAGLQVRQTNGDPGADVEIRIRGWGTFGANTFPLVVVDGIITTAGLSDIDPSNIENISILKDASSAAIYGSRGANGVVLVTTKRGKAGKEIINFETYYSVDNVIRKIPTVNAIIYGEMVNDFYTNAGKDAPYSDTKSLGQGTNWQDEIFRTGGKQNYSLSISGGSEKAQHALTMSWNDTKGIVVNSKYNRVNFRINNDISPLKGLKIGNSIGLSNGIAKNGNPQEAIDRALIYAPNVKPYNEDGSYGIANMAGQPTTMSQPLVAAYERYNSQTKLRALASIYAEYEIIKGLKFRSNLGIEYNNFDGSYFTPSYNYGLGNSNGTAVLDRNTNNTKNWMVDNLLTYTKSFAQSHNIDILAGYTFQDERWEYLNAHKDGFSRNDDYLRVLDAGTANDIAHGNITEWAIQSYLGRFNYSYKNKYLFNSNVRIDQSSRFKKSNRTGIFPSFSVGWILTNEKFLNEKLGSISYLKLRGGYGILGNQAISNYPYQSIINSNLYYDLGSSQSVVPGAAPTGLANTNISWEKTSTTGAGLEVNFFRDKLKFIIDYYDRRTSDILVIVPLPSLSGLGSNPYQNVGGVRNNGFEFTVNYANTSKNKHLSYNVGFNLTNNHNEVTKLDKGLDIILAGGGQGGTETRTSLGHGINSFYGFVQDGIFQTKEEILNSPAQPNAQPGDMKFKDLNNDQVIDSQDRTFLGNFMAKQIFGLNGNVRYKNFDLAVSVNGDLGRYQNIFSVGFAAARAAESTNAMWADRWTGPGTSNFVPRIVGGDPNNNARSSTFWVRKQDFLRIQNLQVGYDFSGKLLSKSGLSRLRIYLAAQNLATFTNWPGYDPELSATAYPLSRSFFFGINLGI